MGGEDAFALADVTGTQSSIGTLKSLSDEAAVKEYLASHVHDGFASSAYWGATGEVPPREPDDIAGKKPHCFEMEINRKIVPFPEEKTSLPRTLDYTLVGLHRLKGGSSEVKPELNAGQLNALQSTASSLGVDIPSAGRPRLMETTSSQNRTIGKGVFDPDVLEALQKGEEDVEASTNRCNQLKNAPLGSVEPDHYRPASWDYCDMSGIDPSSYWVLEKDPNDPEGGTKVPVYKSRYNLVEKEAPVRREKTATMMERERNVDRGLLKDTLRDMKTNALPEGYQPWSAASWMSTMRDCHAPYDIAKAAETNKHHATTPLPRTYHTLTPAHEQAVLSLTQRQLRRNQGNWATEYSDSYLDRSDEADVKKDYSKKSIFGIKHGTCTMHHSAHHPRDDTATGETYSPSQIVPGQYTTMARQPLHARNKVD